MCYCLHAGDPNGNQFIRNVHWWPVINPDLSALFISVGCCNKNIRHVVHSHPNLDVIYCDSKHIINNKLTLHFKHIHMVTFNLIKTYYSIYFVHVTLNLFN